MFFCRFDNILFVLPLRFFFIIIVVFIHFFAVLFFPESIVCLSLNHVHNCNCLIQILHRISDPSRFLSGVFLDKGPTPLKGEEPGTKRINTPEYQQISATRKSI